MTTKDTTAKLAEKLAGPPPRERENICGPQADEIYTHELRRHQLKIDRADNILRPTIEQLEQQVAAAEILSAAVDHGEGEAMSNSRDDLKPPFAKVPRWMLLVLMVSAGLVIHLTVAIVAGAIEGIKTWRAELSDTWRIDR